MADVICVPTCQNPGITDVPDPTGASFDAQLVGTRATFKYDPRWPMYQGKPHELDPDGVPFYTYGKGRPGATVGRLDGGFLHWSCLWYRFSAQATDDYLKGYAWAYSSLYRFFSYSTRISMTTIEVAIEVQDKADECMVRAERARPKPWSEGQTYTQIEASVVPDKMEWSDEVDIALTMQASVSGGGPSAGIGAGGGSASLPAPAEGMSVSVPLSPARKWRAKSKSQPIPTNFPIAPTSGPTARIEAPVIGLAAVATATLGLVAFAVANRPG